MHKHDIIVIGASAGGVETLSKLVAALPANLPAAVFVVLHIARHGTSVLPEILSKAGKLPACFPVSGQPVEPGNIYVAPNDQHLLVKEGYMILSNGPMENGFRPSISALFRTAANSYGSRVVGVILTGLLDNGSAGVVAIKRRGGMVIVQNPADALFPDMPKNALRVVEPDYVLPLEQIPQRLVALAREESNSPQPEQNSEPDSAETGSAEDIYNGSGKISRLACPDCGGVLVEYVGGKDDHLIRFKCQVGHAYSLESLQAQHADTTEAALWAAVRALQESSYVSQRMVDHAQQFNDLPTLEKFQAKVEESKQHADVIRQLLLSKRP